MMSDKYYQKKYNKRNTGEKYEDVITTHINADFDALASMIAARKLYPNAALVFPGSQEKNLRNFFLHSTSYLFNFVKLKQIDFSYIKRLILVDTRQRSRIGKFAELADRNDVEIHIYDHHPDSEEDMHGKVEVIRKLGSCTAILTPLIKEKSISITPDEATIMCVGIHEDTGSFTFSSTTAEDYKAAAWLTEQGAKHNIIADMLTRELTAEQVWLLNDLTKSATTSIINGVEVVITKIVRDDYIGDAAVMVHKFMEMENLDVVFALAQMQDRIHIIARSRIEEVNVAEIALALGGGGHPQAASASVKDKTLAQVERLLRSLLRSRVNPIKKARDMMSSPVIHIGPDENLKQATSLMTRYNINVLLVIDKNGILKGYLTRQVVEKAVFFGLEDIKANEYMNIDFSTINPEAPLKEVQELIIRNKIRVLPVVDDEKVLGVITRTDLMNILLGEPLIPQFLYDSKSASHYTRKKNMAALLKERLPRNIIKMLKEIGQVADMLEYNAYLVGGLVRDVLLKIENLDVDIVIEGDGIKFAHEFIKHHKARVRSHRKFGTAVVIFPDGFKVDVATARMEYYEFPGAPPIVESSSLRMDLYRRDFAVNALAVKLNKKDYGVLVDYFGAQKDIKDRVLRVLHNLSFVEDPTRVFRAIRFEQRFGFKIGRLTLSLMRNAVKINCFKDVSGRRLFLELKLILKEQDPIGAINRMDEFDLLQFISPEIELTDKIKLLLEETKKVIAWYYLTYVEHPLEPWKVYWHTLTSSLEKTALETIVENLGMTDVEGRRLVSQRLAMPELLTDLFKLSGDNYQLYSLLAPFDTESLLFIMARTNNERIKRNISLYFTQLKGVKIKLTGKDLSRIGFKPGPIFKDIFNALLEARLNNLIKSREEEIDFVMENFPLH
ncbi:MAG TPA: CBS domain-containing protein [Desulfobacteraceae bacterium]|nr:CBS domain-containing protein [Desulfobacteraceae bacterium]HPJ66221.1 CBS domain-containing protein [Desulfobacteraceae bacterium]HPQ28739.1 CBS domain-containing protein [Desulfobacteraceae bacterium]